jgi:hypothetical protein
MIKKAVLISIPVLTAVLFSFFGIGRAGAEETDIVIVKYGKVSVKSTIPDAKIFIDDNYEGTVENVVDNVLVGQHTITCRTDSKSVSGKFTVKKDETLRLEARFDENKLTIFGEHEQQEKAAVAEKKPVIAAPAAKPEKPKKIVAEVKKEEKKDPVEERRELHLNIIKVFFEDIDSPDVRVSHKINQKVITKFTEKRNKTGTYYRTKKDILLCDAGPCEQQWSASYQYTDEKGASDSFGLTWKQIVFNGITPTGTSKRELIYCLNNNCKTLEDSTAADKSLSGAAGRYQITWSKSLLVIRRSDIVKEITDSGGVVEAY